MEGCLFEGLEGAGAVSEVLRRPGGIWRLRHELGLGTEKEAVGKGTETAEMVDGKRDEKDAVRKQFRSDSFLTVLQSSFLMVCSSCLFGIGFGIEQTRGWR